MGKKQINRSKLSSAVRGEVGKTNSGQTTWDDALELASNINEAIGKIETGMSHIKASSILMGKLSPGAVEKVTATLNEVSVIKKSVAEATASVPKQRGVTVNEDRYPDYLLTYGTLSDIYGALANINDEVVAKLVVPFGEVGVEVLNIVESERKNDNGTV